MAGLKTIEWYERQLDNDKNLSPSKIAEYEAEIERLADIEAKVYARIQERNKEELKRFEEIKSQLQAGNTNVIDLVGIPEFGDDYELCEEIGGLHVVYSKVARDDQEHRHVYNNSKDAVSHYRKLIWDRLYSKYVRTGEVDSLKQME